ncbi:MAG: biopolymer transporter ExbD [Acidobacteria bacterium]|nr:biopolymer transporter ExbD [Acidobacteriota bacterium]
MKTHIGLLSHALVVLILAPFSPQQINPNDLQTKLGHSSFSTSVQAPIQTIEADSVVVAVVSDDEIYVNKVRVARREVATEVDRRLSLIPEESRIVYIKAMPEVSYGTIVGIIEEVRARGYYRIGLVADKAQSQRGADMAPARKTKTSEGSARLGAWAPGREEAQLTVTVEALRRGGLRVKVGKIRTPLRKIADSIRAHLRGKANKSVMIVAPGRIQYGSVKGVIDEAKKGGAEVVELSIKQQ